MKKYLSILLIVMLVVVGCGKKDEKESNSSKSESNTSSKYASAPDTIESCPNCVYSNEVGSFRENDMYEYKPLSKDKYSGDWKKIAAESDIIDIFFGYVLDDNGYIVDPYVCSVYYDIPYCLGLDIEKNKELIYEYFEDDCSHNGFICYIPKGKYGKGNAVFPSNVGGEPRPEIHGYFEYKQDGCASISINKGYTYRLNICGTEVEDFVNDVKNDVGVN